ncbi:MAG TPA: fatty acid--CoA ligase family protein [Stellaceae bacterium]|jgi:acyl-coenzyme A synthetase/AMP-(fatty) acid ligase
MTDFTAVICHHALSMPDQPAIILADRVATYGMIGRGMMSVEARLAAFDLKPGALVAVAITSPIRHLIVAAALYRRGHPTLSVWRTRDIPAIGLPIAAILEGDGDALAPGLNQIPVDDGWFTGPSPPVTPAPSRGFASSEDACRIELSSGTTGKPKAIALSVFAVERWIQNYYLSIGQANWTRMLSLPGLPSSWGFSLAAHALRAGKTLVFAPDARQTLALMSLYSVDCLVGAPQHLRELIALQRAAPTPLPALKLIFTGGSLHSPVLLRDAAAHLCSEIVVQYGSTEAGATAFAHAGRLSEAGAVGFVAPWAEVQAVDEAGRVLPVGSEGALRIRADCQGRPFPEKSGDDNFRDGWFYPGDVGRVRDDGMLSVLGRASEIINAGGTKVAPETIEDAVRRHDGVADVAALGVVDDASGIEELWLAVVPRGIVDPAAITAWCRTADIPVGRVVTVTAIPRNALGKINRETLKRELTG